MATLKDLRLESQELVTGGGRGLGRAFAHALADAGAKVVVTARSADQIAETAVSMTEKGGRALAIAADVSDRQAVARWLTPSKNTLTPSTLHRATAELDASYYHRHKPQRQRGREMPAA